MQSMLFNHNGIKLGINNWKKFGELKKNTLKKPMSEKKVKGKN